jgi:hypothetical protein
MVTLEPIEQEDFERFLEREIGNDANGHIRKRKLVSRRRSGKI